MNQMPCDYDDNANNDDQQQLLATLKAERERIAAIDAEIMKLIRQRQDVARQIGQLKKQLHKPVLDQEMEGLVLTRNTRYARQLGLSLARARTLTKLLMAWARKEQES